ncbi:phospholipase D-like domain-containing protein [Glycomyces xiaoerkulensis]|uniref:phospholipase D-like domain-containing protein n=1 Tax=Glycomyces xiaoerkulensis TaxID=2038139 RepID=UPI0018E428F6|nr:phospholipase D family protein [Glycomyces xiaoerkulensis]
MIDDATDAVCLSSFLVGDDQLHDALLRAARRLNGGVRVIANIQAKLENPDLGTVAHPLTVPSEEMRERQRFEALSGLGVMIRGYPGCHAKFAVVDDRAALVHSANFMARAFDITGENGVAIFDPDEVKRALYFFDRLWSGARWEMDTTGERTVAPRTPESPGQPLRPPTTRQQNRGLIWTFHDEHLIHSTIIDLIASADDEILLSTFNISDMTRRPELLHHHLRDAVSRGVTVELLLRARSGPEAGEEASALMDLGVELYPCTLNHTKGVIADRTRGALFSANFDGRFGLDRDVELGVRLDGIAALTDARRFFEHSMAEHDRTFVRNPDVRTLAEGWRTSPWPIADRVEVTVDSEDWKLLADLRDGPVVFEQDSEVLYLYADHWSWRLRPGYSSSKYLLERCAPQAEHAMTRLWNPRHRSTGVLHGLCTAVFSRT